MAKSRDILTTGEVAKICRVAPRTVSKWFDSGQLRGYRIPGSKDRRIPRDQLRVFMNKHGIPLNGLGDGNTCPDASGVGASTASVRAERSGTRKVPGDGRVYHIAFSADDGQGGQCTGTVTVCVPHDQRLGGDCVDQGPMYDSTVCY